MSERWTGPRSQSQIGGASLVNAPWNKPVNTEAEAIALFEAGRDFSASKAGMAQGYCSIRDFRDGDMAQLRYGRFARHCVTVTVREVQGKKRAFKNT